MFLKKKNYDNHLEGVGDPHFLSIDDVIITLSDCSGGDGGHITSRPWLTHSKTGNLYIKRTYYLKNNTAYHVP